MGGAPHDPFLLSCESIRPTLVSMHDCGCASSLVSGPAAAETAPFGVFVAGYRPGCHGLRNMRLYEHFYWSIRSPFQPGVHPNLWRARSGWRSDGGHWLARCLGGNVLRGSGCPENRSISHWPTRYPADASERRPYRVAEFQKASLCLLCSPVQFETYR